MSTRKRMKTIRTTLAAAFAALGLALSAMPAHAFDVVDERGVAVSLPQPPQRIVTCCRRSPSRCARWAPATGWWASTAIPIRPSR
jgi:hypothetical protein